MKSILSALLFAALAVPAFGLNPSVPTPLAEKGFVTFGKAGVASVGSLTAGTGYTSPPAVSFTGGGGGGIPPVATSTLKVVSGTTPTSGGTGYSTTQVLTVVGGTGTAATLTVSAVSSGVITAVTITTGGTYTVIPTNPVSITGGAGTGATFTLGYGVGSVIVSSAGKGYTTAPTVVFTGGAGSSAAGTAVLDGQATGAITAQFREIQVLSTAVISAITFPTSITTTIDPANGLPTSTGGAYFGDLSIVGSSLAVGSYKIYGNTVTFSSGTGILILRAAQ